VCGILLRDPPPHNGLNREQKVKNIPKSNKHFKKGKKIISKNGALFEIGIFFENFGFF
jgi:hypothetical protein